MTKTALAWQQKMTETATKLMVAYEIPRILGLALAHLYENGVVSRIEFKEKLSSFSTKDTVSMKNVDRVIHRLRKQLGDYGIEIMMIRTVGISLTPESQDLISEAINEYDKRFRSRKNALDARDVKNGESLHESGS